MKKFWRRLKLVFSNYTEEELISQLVKVELGLLAYEEVDLSKHLNKMPSQDRLEYLFRAFQFANSTTFKDLKAILIGNFTLSTINGAVNLHHFICGKMTIYGVKYFCEQIESMAARYMVEIKEVEKTVEEIEDEDYLGDQIL